MAESNVITYLVLNTTDQEMLMNRAKDDALLRHFLPPAEQKYDRTGDRTLLVWNSDDWKLGQAGGKAFTECLKELGIPYAAVSKSSDNHHVEEDTSFISENLRYALWIEHTPADSYLHHEKTFNAESPRALLYVDLKDDLMDFFNENADLAEAVWNEATGNRAGSYPHQRVQLAVEQALKGRLLKPHTAYYGEMRDYLAKMQTEYTAYNKARNELKAEFGKLPPRNRSLPEQFTMEYVNANIKGIKPELQAATASLLANGKYLVQEVQKCLRKCAPERFLPNKPLGKAVQDGSLVLEIKAQLDKNKATQR